MSNDTLEIKAALMMGKPVHEVFEAIVDPSKMSNYFISKSTGRMEEGKTLTWQFPEMDGAILGMVPKHWLNLRSLQKEIQLL